MKQNQKGITILGLLITVVVIVIIAGVCIYTGRNLLEEAKQTNLETNKLLIQAAAKTLYDKKTLDDSVELIGTKITEENKPENWNDFNAEYYIIDKSDLENMGINIEADEIENINELENNKNVYIVSYEKNWVGYYNNDFERNYQVVEYIESTGTQYINTQISLFNSPTWKIELDFMPTSFYDYNAILGTANGTTTHEAWIPSSGDFYCRYNGIKPNGIKLTVNKRVKLTIDYDGSTVYEYIDDVLKTSYSASPSLLDSELYLLRRLTNYGKDRIYAVRLYGEGKLLRDYIPCYNREYPDSKIGLYDLVKDEFHENQGTGTFVKGNNV